MSQYSINPVSRGVNNFFEALFVGTNNAVPQYIQPIQQPIYTPPPQPVYTPQPYNAPTFTPIPSAPLPTVTYTPSTLQSSFVPLNSNYNSAYYGR
jgi:hypothetical protein